MILRFDDLKDNFGPNQSVLGLALFLGGRVQIVVAVMEFSILLFHGEYT
jgi:succinate-acetate transporter protein